MKLQVSIHYSDDGRHLYEGNYLWNCLSLLLITTHGEIGAWPAASFLLHIFNRSCGSSPV
jgi:6-phosphogluconolactonase (cycloisomerase 2 family)